MTQTIQLADFAGVWGVSFVLATVNGMFVDLLTMRPFLRDGNRSCFNPALRRRVVVVLILLASVLFYGSRRINQGDFREGPRVILIQTNLEQRLKNDNAAQTLEQAVLLTGDVADVPADLVVWPETSYPYFYGDIDEETSDTEIDRLWRARGGRGGDERDPAKGGARLRESLTAAREELTRITDDLGKPLLVGTIRSDFRPGLLRQYNSSVLFAPGQGAVAHYDKLHLVPFGEYLPLKETLPILKALMPYDADANFGLDNATEPVSIHFGGLSFAPLICFEDTLPHLARDFIRRQAPDSPIEFFVNQSNDGWFQGSVEADYHLAASVFRCIECRVPMVRVSNTGITALVDGNGRLAKVFAPQGKTKLVAGGMDAVIPIDDRQSLYVLLGDWLGQLCLTFVLLGISLSTFRHACRIGALLRKSGRRL